MKGIYFADTELLIPIFLGINIATPPHSLEWRNAASLGLFSTRVRRETLIVCVSTSASNITQVSKRKCNKIVIT